MASNGSRGLWLANEQKRARLAEVERDVQALNDIHKILDGEEWDSDTLDKIVEIVRETGREVRDSDGIHERT